MTSIHDARGSVLRTVSLTAGGALVVRGHDLGPAVVRAFGGSEYEFERSYSAADTQRLRSLIELRPDDDLLTALAARFSNTHALEVFARDHGLPGTFWSRVGD